MKKLVVLTGAGISAESGLQTFRDMGGLWENYDVMEVASPEGWAKDPELVLNFYNERRRQLYDAKPNKGHLGLVELEKNYSVEIITQNIDDLHERAGSKNVLHLHGELKKACSSLDLNLVYDLDGKNINPGDKCEKGSQLRPYVVWFGEPVPAIEEASVISSQADIFVVIGTSLNVYPAAGLIHYVPAHTDIYLIDPNDLMVNVNRKVTIIKENASTGVYRLIDLLSKNS